ncbi:hypothetical protein PPNSA23_42180 [Phyllobacterium phragmitis]|uniref:Uncharacterized protein n=1 Tax=Phyllobacterium phragmitis TaxID=2670329 RepID=A0ABQ0H5T9_9HYPH
MAKPEERNPLKPSRSEAVAAGFGVWGSMVASSTICIFSFEPGSVALRMLLALGPDAGLAHALRKAIDPMHASLDIAFPVELAAMVVPHSAIGCNGVQQRPFLIQADLTVQTHMQRGWKI